MSWQEDLQSAVRALAVRSGSTAYPLSAEWSLVDFYTHLRSCGADTSRGVIRDTSWQAGCECDSTTVQGIEVEVSCKCGHIRDVPFRLEAGLGDIIGALKTGDQ